MLNDGVIWLTWFKLSLALPVVEVPPLPELIEVACPLLALDLLQLLMVAVLVFAPLLLLVGLVTLLLPALLVELIHNQ